MLARQIKKELSEKIQALLQEVNDSELPKGEISFILHIDGAEDWSWANIRNYNEKDTPVPNIIDRNLSRKKDKYVDVYPRDNGYPE